VTDRLFLGVALSDEVRHGLAAFLESEVGSIPARAAPPENWHVTLRFLGATDDLARDRILATLDQAALPAPFRLGFGRLGAFPRPARATVLWLGVSDGAEELATLALVCEEAALEAGFEPEERPFHPHLTLSRIRPWQDVGPVVDRVPSFPLHQTVDRITMYRSVLGGGPARYEVVDEVLLG
jgi:2'-5' RNA ligase